MKTKTFSIPYTPMILILFLTFFISCSDIDQDDFTSVSEISDGVPWYEQLDQFDSPSGIIVTEGTSIQDAINEANTGDAIYIEPGNYRGPISFKSTVKLVGLSNDSGRSVIIENSGINSNQDIPTGIEMKNIQFRSINGKVFKASANKTKEKSNEKFITMTREEFEGNVAHYKFDVRLGHGKYEHITLHRLVRENSKYRPVETQGNIFMVHGASQNFEDIFLVAGEPNISVHSSIPMYLASNGIDVWGIDLGWTRVPAEETDFSFMEHWGVERDVDDVLKSMTIARVIRGITKQGFGRMNLLGFSYSVSLAYVAAGLETQEHWIKRDINGIIPIDGLLKIDPQKTDAIQQSCGSADYIKGVLESGIFQNQNGVYAFGQLAAANPDGPSPIIPGFTNFQAALFVGTNLYNIAPTPNPHWHFVAGLYDNGIPYDLAYSSADRWIQLLAAPHAGPYMPQKTGYDLNVCQCNIEDSPLDDYFTDIEIPIFYIGSGGATEADGFYTVDQLKSQDKTKYIVSLNPEPTLDFGHGDLFIANNADSEVWEVIRQWVLGHN